MSRARRMAGMASAGIATLSVAMIVLLSNVCGRCAGEIPPPRSHRLRRLSAHVNHRARFAFADLAKPAQGVALFLVVVVGVVVLVLNASDAVGLEPASDLLEYANGSQTGLDGLAQDAGGKGPVYLARRDHVLSDLENCVPDRVIDRALLAA